MRMLSSRSLVPALAAAAALVALTGCPKGIPGRGGSGKVDPNSCGNYAVSDAGRKLKAFFEATVKLNDTVVETEQVVKTSCKMMGTELGMAPGDLEGTTNDVCARVITTIRDNLKVSIKGEAGLKVDYKPAVCTVDIQATARAAAECEAKAEADIAVRCEGSCTGTCSGACDGTCHAEGGTGGSSGQCNGHCEGSCGGTCSGGCDGHADVEASAQCKAQAEVNASVDVQCTEAELNIEAKADVIVDASKAEMTIKALKAGLPKILSVKARLKPLKAAVATWARSAKELGESASDLAGSFKDQALCISGQIAGAAAMVANIQASVDVSVSVSVEASASAGVN